jgi:maltooligosyltrehalose trehalohydrolase
MGFENERVLLLNRRHQDEQVVLTLNFNHFSASISLPLSEGRWNKILDSTDVCWRRIGSQLPAAIEVHGTLKLTLPPDSVAVFARSAVESAN